MAWKYVRSGSFALSGFLSLFWLTAPAAAGQGAANPAGITGLVTDGSGGVLPGTTVTATGPALQVPSVVAVTDERGEYRLSPLPIGVYTVSFELAGFQSFRRQGVLLTVGFVARVDAVLSVGAVAETITVSGASPLVDTTSTTTSTELTRDQLEVLPTSRDGFHAFMNQVAGVRTNLDVGSSGLGSTVLFRAYGQTGSAWQLFEGVIAASTSSTGAGGSHVDFNAVDGTRVAAVGNSAEMPRRGLLVDSVVRSGGNEFHGSAVAYGSGPKLEGNNIDDSLAAAGIRLAKLQTVKDFSGNLGGRIIRNKLWFFGGGRYQKVSRDILDAFDADGAPIQNVKRGTYHLEKVSYQMSPGNRITGFYHIYYDSELRGASRFVPRESMTTLTLPTWIAKGEWQAVRGNAFVASVQVGRMDFGGHYDGVSPTKVATTDIVTLAVTGDAFASNGRRPNQGRFHSKGVVSYYKPDLVGGNHEFKAGVDHLWNWFDETWIVKPFNYQLRFNNGAPFQMDTQNSPVFAPSRGDYVGIYAQDAWTIARRLTLNLGFRVARDDAYAPSQCREAATFQAAQCWDRVDLRVFNSFVPRLHGAFDLFGDGKNVIKGGWGRFVQMREIEPDVTNVNRNSAMTTRWDWHDLNGNKQYEPGEVNLDPNGPDYRGLSGTALGQTTSLAVPNPNEVQPKTDEFSLTFERELVANTAVRVTGVYSRNFDVFGLSELDRDGRYTIPATNRDPGPDGRLGTADDTGNSVTYYEYPVSLGAAAFSRTMIVNDANNESTFKTFEIAGVKRPSNNWQLGASYSTTWVNVPITCAVNGAGIGTATSRCLSTPNNFINMANETREWQIKLSGAYTLPYGILASANYDVRSGAPQARQVLFTGGQTIRSITLNVEPLGTFALPNTHELDIRAAKRVSVGPARSIELRFDLYNILNEGTVLSQNLQSGATYLRPSTILFPRILQLGATFNF